MDLEKNITTKTVNTYMYSMPDAFAAPQSSKKKCIQLLVITSSRLNHTGSERKMLFPMFVWDFLFVFFYTFLNNTLYKASEVMLKRVF